MLIPWWPVLLYPLPLLVIPLAVALGQIVRGGPVTVMSVGAALGLASFWLAQGEYYSSYPSFNSSAQAALSVAFSALVCGVLLVSAWTLALTQAFRARQ